MSRKLALFDFDGTVTANDSLLKFIRFVVGDVKFMTGFFMLSPILVLYKMGVIPNYKAKQKLLAWFFKGYTKEEFKKIANEYSLNHIEKMLCPKAMEKINWHKEQGHKVVVVSASIDCWLRPWCEKNNLELLATKLEFKNGIVTGKLLSNNCYGQEKVNRIKREYDLSKFDFIYAYGDSRGDKEMLALANESFYKPFR